MAWSTTGLVFGLWAAVAVVAVLAAGGAGNAAAGKKAALPHVRDRLALAMQHALAGADAAAVGGVDNLIAEHAPADQIPPGLREAIDIVFDGVNRRYGARCARKAVVRRAHRVRVVMHVRFSYTLYTPTTYNAAVASPVLLSIHSAVTSPLISVRQVNHLLARKRVQRTDRDFLRTESQATWTALDWVAEEGPFLTIYPKGIDRVFNAGPNCCAANSCTDAHCETASDVQWAG